VVTEVADRISVMYAGRLVEHGTAEEGFEKPAHPYTRGLLDSMPKLIGEDSRLYAIPGLPPSLTNVPPGCPFAPRCPRAVDVCRHDPPPPEIELWSQRTSACHFAEEVLAHGVR
jgi:oligopeptide transport system ATP-binding protein